MFGWILGAVGIGIALYELLTRPTAEDIAAAAAGASGAKSGPIMGPSGPRPPQAQGNPTYRYDPNNPVSKKIAEDALYCDMLPTDMADAEKWSSQFVTATMPLAPRLNLMRSIVPPLNWPMPARRVWCFLVRQGKV